jgi:hypothetical protein
MGNAVSEPSDDTSLRRSPGVDHPQPAFLAAVARDTLASVLVEMLCRRWCQPPVRSPGGGKGWRTVANSVRNLLHLVARGSDQWIHRYTPDLIKGDLDSLRADVREYYVTQVRSPALQLDRRSYDSLESTGPARLGSRYDRSHEVHRYAGRKRTRGRAQGQIDLPTNYSNRSKRSDPV